MKPKLCKAGVKLRELVDDAFIGRDRSSDGWLGDTRHSARVSDHNPDADGWVRAIDLDADLTGKSKPEIMPDLADQIRLAGKAGDSRIAYVIFNGKIASSKKRWAWRPYDGINKHTKHAHISFTKKGDLDGSAFKIPLLGA